MASTDRLGNPNINFPIGVCYAENDFFGSEGADDIIRNSKHYQSGKSQLIKFKDATHSVSLEKPKELSELIIGFNEGSVVGRFEIKRKYDIAIAPFPHPTEEAIKKMNKR